MGRPLKREPDQAGEATIRERVITHRECSVKKSESLSRTKTSPTTKAWAEAIEGLRLKGFTLELLLKCEEMARTTFYYHRFRMGIESKDVGLRYLTNISHS